MPTAPNPHAAAFTPFTELAHVTGDAYSTHLSDHCETHPVYGTDAYRMRVEGPLTSREEDLFAEITTSKIGDVVGHIRSSIAQLGNDAFHPDTTEYQRKNGRLIIDTLLTNLNGERGNSVIDVHRALLQDKHQPKIGNVGLFPHASRVGTAQAIEDLRQSKSLIVADDAQVNNDGSVNLPIQDALYTFNPTAWTRELIAKMLLGEGRPTLSTTRMPITTLPDYIGDDDFLVTGVELETKECHVVFRHKLIIDGWHAQTVHTQSRIMGAGRTRGRDRQLELYKPWGEEEELASLKMVADLYRASAIAQAGH